MSNNMAAKAALIHKADADEAALTLSCAAWWYLWRQALLVATDLKKLASASCRSGCQLIQITRILQRNKTRQGYARKRILKPAGYFFLPLDSYSKYGTEGAK